MRRSLLRPWSGRSLPVDLRPSSVLRQAAAFPEGVRDPQLPPLLSRIDTGPIHPGNRVSVYFDGQETFAAAGAAIDAAEREVLLESYIIRDDQTGRATLEVLARAAARGVAVRVLADAWGSWTTRAAFWKDMQRGGVNVRLFHPLWKRWRFRGHRDHRKILVVDRSVAFTGGMNVADEYGSSWRVSDTAWRDTHVRLEGPAAVELALVFQEGWTRSGGRPFDAGMPTPAEPAPAGARILVVDTRAGRGQPEKISTLAALIGATRRRLWVTNAYFAPGMGSVELFGDAARRGVDVRLLLPGRSDVPLLKHAGHGYYADLLARGVRVFEYQPHTLHAKTIVADDYVSMIGSSNFDARSLHFNAECNVLILDEETGRAMSGAFERDLQAAEEIDRAAWPKRGMLHRLGDAAARRLTPIL
ncbi:MAG: hypothetical protein DMF79_02575 [Acidobacteria bacterium]|nr:MAG: hypothetical protein DMF79_02575 [Acidobacteriota bacterium]